MPQSDSHHYFMRQALLCAEKAALQNEVPVGAVIVHNDHVIAEGWNQPIQRHDPTAHAEMMAIRQAGLVLENYRLTGCTMYVTLEPCVMCVGAMIHARIARLYFGAFDPKTGAVESCFQLLANGKHNHTILFEGGIESDQCAHQLKSFFAARRR